MRFRAENLAFYRFIRKTLKYDSASAPVIEILASLGIAGIFWYGLHRVISGAITQGELVCLHCIGADDVHPGQASDQGQQLDPASIGAAERVFEVLDEIPEIDDAPDAQAVTAGSGERSNSTQVSFLL